MTQSASLSSERARIRRELGAVADVLAAGRFIAAYTEKVSYLLSMWRPVWRRRDSHSGSRTELENLTGDAKRKGTSGSNREAESIDAPIRVGLLHSSDEAG
jgi:hypothetical protein